MKAKCTVVTDSQNFTTIRELLSFESYANFGIPLLSELFNEDHNQKLSDNFLYEIASKNEENYDCFKMLKLPPASLQFRLSKGSSDASHAMAHLLFCRRETTERTKGCLKSRMDEFSMFAGRNPLVRMAY